MNKTVQSNISSTFNHHCFTIVCQKTGVSFILASLILYFNIENIEMNPSMHINVKNPKNI